jgi:Rps23 Pro-64 3,4-dihydroxylase Tpa1-like proline 4-hydroxylase
MENINEDLLKNESLEKLKDNFNTAPSFRHICIDNFLPSFFAEELMLHFPSIHEMKKHYNGINEKKSEESDFNKLHNSFQRLRILLSSEFFIQWLEKLTGIMNLSVPVDFRGAGIYQGGHGSFLDTHIDFSIHPTLNIQRRINVLLFFNKDWQEDWGGNLEFWDETVTTCLGRFSPVFNRCIIFECSDISYHGYDKITAPKDVFRKSFYLYVYSPFNYHIKYHDTVFKLKPGVTSVKKIKTAFKEKLKWSVKNSLRLLGMKKLLDKLEK